LLETSTKNQFQEATKCHATEEEAQGLGVETFRDCFGHLNDHFPPKIPFLPQSAWTNPLSPRLTRMRITPLVCHLFVLLHGVTKKKSGLSQKRDQPILVVIGSQNKNPLADFLDRFVCARYSSLKSGIPAISLLFSYSLKNQ